MTLDVTPNRSQHQIKNGDVLLTYIGLLTMGKPAYEPLLVRLDSGNDAAENIGILVEAGCHFIMEHFRDALTEGKADAALAASLFHYKELEIREVKEYLRKEGISVRL